MKFTLNCGVLGEQELDIDFEYIPPQRGKYDGPFEDCYPDEPEELYVFEVKWGDLDITDKVNLRDIEDAIRDAVVDAYEAEKEDAILAKYERKQEDELCETW